MTEMHKRYGFRGHWTERVSEYPSATQVGSRVDSPEPGRSATDWPYPTKYETYLVSGILADDVRAKWGLDHDVPVVITEETVSDGYSCETQENNYPFTVQASDRGKRFDSLSELLDWVAGH